MNTPFQSWAAKWGVSQAALDDLVRSMTFPAPPPSGGPRSEAWTQSQVRLEAGRKGIPLFRNNVGALQDLEGRWVRFGLANDSKQVNEVIKSHDLVGLRRVLITPAMVGGHIGQFVCREMKEEGWRYAGTKREQAQLRFATLVNAHGGDAAFATGEGTL